VLNSKHRETVPVALLNAVHLYQAEEEVREVRQLRAELEAKSKEEDARSIFLHFTQEQLNSQVSSVARNMLLFTGASIILTNIKK
jgi:hypothetical protein